MRNNICFIIIISICALCSSQANSYELEGVWRIEAKQGLLQYMKQQVKTDPRLKKLSKEKKQAALKKAASMKIRMTIRFEYDASFALHMSRVGNSRNLSGTWKTDAQKNSNHWQIQIKEEKAEPESIEIEWKADNAGRIRFLDDQNGLVGWMDIERIGPPKPIPVVQPEIFEANVLAVAQFKYPVQRFELADFNEDGLLDIVLVTEVNHNIYLVPGEPGATLGEPRLLYKPGNKFLSSGVPAVGDVNGDGHSDIVMGNFWKVLVLYGDGSGGFDHFVLYDFKNQAVNLEARFLRLADLNNDGRDDVIGSGTEKAPGISVALANEDGSLSPPILYPGKRYYPAISTGDINNDGEIDVVAAGDKWLVAFTGNGDGSLNAERGIQRQRVGTGPFIEPVGRRQAPHLYDSNSDGVIDRLMLRSGRSGNDIFDLNNSADMFTRHSSIIQHQAYIPFQIKDLNADGLADFSRAIHGHDQSGKTTIQVLTAWGQEDATYSDFPPKYTSAPNAHLRIVDMDADGKLDAITIYHWPIPGVKTKSPESCCSVISILRGIVKNAGPPLQRKLVTLEKISTTGSVNASKETKQSSEKEENTAKPKLTTEPLPEWETVGYWTYDAVDGQHLNKGLVLRNNPGSFATESWIYQLELTNHSQLLPRNRILWPVQINRQQKKVCVNSPYPTYPAVIDLPGDEFDGEYVFASCKGGS